MLIDGPAPAKFELVAVPMLAIPDIVTQKYMSPDLQRHSMFIYKLPMHVQDTVGSMQN